jgi:hypothetical protein
MSFLRGELLNDYRQRLDYLRREIETHGKEHPTYADLLRDLARTYEQRIRDLERDSGD